jgi:hypothetical protein
MDNMQPAPMPASRRQGVLVYLIVATILFGLSLIPASVGALMSLMAFDSGPSRMAWIVVSLAWAYPVLVIVGLLLAWIFYSLKAHRAAIACSLLPLLDFVAIAVFWLAE